MTDIYVAVQVESFMSGPSREILLGVATGAQDDIYAHFKDDNQQINVEVRPIKVLAVPSGYAADDLRFRTAHVNAKTDLANLKKTVVPA